MAEFTDEDLAGSTFTRVDLTGARFEQVVAAELDRRHPERQLLHPTTAERFRRAWAAVCAGWEPTIERARQLPEAALHERVDHERSFLQTLRHLVFCVDAWLLRAVLGELSPYWPASVQHDEMGADTPVPIDPHADPDLDEVPAVRAVRHARVDDFLVAVTDEQLAGTTTPVGSPGYPPDVAYPVARCLGAVVQEEFLHRTFAERDLAVLEARAAEDSAGR